MTAQLFIDTNVLIYAGSSDLLDSEKRATAIDLLGKKGLGFSAQVMQEYFHVAYRKGRLGISYEEAVATLHVISRFPVAPITADLVLLATNFSMRFQISYWDAAILAAAKQLGCHTLYTEDLNHGQKYEDVQVINPFL
jgi:predicted nucleic acid-binding protein